jgi:PAS domain S-box-containing protein
MKFRPELPLARKLTLTMMATSSAALLVACVFFLSYDVITLRHDIVDHLHTLAGITGANVAAALTYNDPKSADLVLGALQAEPHIVAARIYDGRRRTFASYHRVPSAPVAPLPDLSPAIGSRLEQNHVTECGVIRFDGESIGTVYLVSDMREIQARMRQFVVFVLILMIAASAAAFLVAVLLKRIIARPILELVETTKTISREKNFGVRAPKYADDELGLLVDGFNEMLTEIEVAEAALRAAHAESELFINSVPSILIGTDSVGRITRWNLAAATTFGLPAGAVLGKPLQHCKIHWHPQPGEEVNSWFQVENSEKRENVMFERDGHRRFLGLTIIKADLFSGEKGTGFLITGADTTDRKIMEEQLRQAQKLEAIGQLAAGIAHEINTPAQFVGDNTNFLQEVWPVVDKILGLCLRLREQSLAGCVAPDLIAELAQCTEAADPAYLLHEVPQAITQALDGVGRISKIVRAMKEFSHPGSEGKCAIDLNHAIETTIAVARNEWKYVAEVQTCFAEHLPPVPCLAGEFNQVILNLLINAAQAIGDVVKKGSASKGMITITTKCEDDWAEVQIQDTGAGIPESVRARIFEPFFTTKEVGKGTGQGLALAHTVIVQKHDGKIWFESEVGKGTTFFLRLPLTLPLA